MTQQQRHCVTFQCYLSTRLLPWPLFCCHPFLTLTYALFAGAFVLLLQKCPFGTACKYAHGHFELWLHPGRFRTKLCSLGGNCRRPVCFFAHSEAELRVTQYSKLDTAAVVAAQQLSQLAADGTVPSITTSPCGSISAGSNVASSVHSGSSDGGDVKAAFVNLSSPCGSEAGLPVRGSPSAACNGLASGYTAGMMLNQQQAAMLEMQFQGNTNAALLAADAVSIAASTAPAMWLGGSSTGMLQQQMPAPTMVYGNVLPQQQQVVYLDAASNTMGFTQGVTALPAAGTDMMNGWMLAPSTAAAPVALNSLQDQWVTNNMLAAAQQRNAAAYGGLAGATAGFSCTPAAAQVQVQGALPMPNMLGGGNVLDQWLQLENAGAYGGPPGLNRPTMGCGISVAPMQQQQQPSAANARMVQLLSTLPDQTVQQLLAGMLAVDAPGA
jgi:hypothetical protein